MIRVSTKYSIFRRNKTYIFHCLGFPEPTLTLILFRKIYFSHVTKTVYLTGVFGHHNETEELFK